MDIRTKIGLRIKSIRNKNGISQNDLAFYAGLDRSYLAGVENGKRNISIINLEKIATALEMSVKNFFDEKSFEELKDLK
jgi:transcriptional regulator with XRE-family HTH domain